MLPLALWYLLLASDKASVLCMPCTCVVEVFGASGIGTYCGGFAVCCACVGFCGPRNAMIDLVANGQKQHETYDGDREGGCRELTQTRPEKRLHTDGGDGPGPSVGAMAAPVGDWGQAFGATHLHHESRPRSQTQWRRHAWQAGHQPWVW